MYRIYFGCFYFVNSLKIEVYILDIPSNILTTHFRVGVANKWRNSKKITWRGSISNMNIWTRNALSFSVWLDETSKIVYVERVCERVIVWMRGTVFIWHLFVAEMQLALNLVGQWQVIIWLVRFVFIRPKIKIHPILVIID